MKRTAFVTWFTLIIAIGITAVLVSIVFPSQTHADEMTVLTAQLLPPGENTCAPLNVSGFTPYIYDGALHGFEFSADDSSYVAIVGAVGSREIPFTYITRRVDSQDILRTHVDVETTPVGRGLSLVVTMLSAKSGGPVCISVISATVAQDGTLLQTTPIPTPVPAPAPTPSTPSPAPGTSTSETIDEPVTTPSPSVGTGTGDIAATGTLSSKNVLKDICDGGGAARMWFVLLVIYAVIVAAAILGQPHMPAVLRSQEWIAAMIVVPFLVLFGIWYFAESCRIGAGIPIVATLIALAGLAAAFWDRSGGDGSSKQGVINLPSETNK